MNPLAKLVHSFYNFFQNINHAFQTAPKRTAAQVAKERLQIIVSHESTRLHGNQFIQKLQSELLDVISKYVDIDRELIQVQLAQSGGQSVLELNVTLPEAIKEAEEA